jgi:hypothetical protein
VVCREDGQGAVEEVVRGEVDVEAEEVVEEQVTVVAQVPPHED